jgi:E3 ubiquitin-protein ligase RFWD3
MSDNGCTCPICFGEYTSSGSHKIISLKCGHLFGSDCIEKWSSIYKKNYCPTCSTIFKKSQFRPIFSTKIVSYEKDKEIEMIEKYIRENQIRKELENEINNLKIQIEIIKSNSFALNNVSSNAPVNIPFLLMNFKKYCKIGFFPDDSKIAFDSINQSVLITSNKLLKSNNKANGIFKYSINGFSIHSFIPFMDPIKMMKISPFGDGLLLVASGNRIDLINIYSENTIKSIPFEFPVTALSFCLENRNKILVADLAGFLYHLDLNNFESKRYRISRENIHNVIEFNSNVFISTVFGIFKINYKINKLNLDLDLIEGDELNVLEKEDSLPSGICTSLNENSDGNVLAIFRNFGYGSTALVLGKRNHHFNPEVKQYLKHEDRFFGGYIFITDDLKNCIKVFDVNSLKMVHSYQFKERIIGYCGDKNVLAILTYRGVYIYDNK